MAETPSPERLLPCRCKACGRLLCEAAPGAVVVIKCRACKVLNRFPRQHDPDPDPEAAGSGPGPGRASHQ